MAINPSMSQKVTFENLWRKDPGALKKEIITIWKQHNPAFEENQAEERAKQIVYVVKNEFEQVVGISTAYKVYIKQFRNYFYSIRLIIVPEFRSQGWPRSCWCAPAIGWSRFTRRINPTHP